MKPFETKKYNKERRKKERRKQNLTSFFTAKVGATTKTDNNNKNQNLLFDWFL